MLAEFSRDTALSRNGFPQANMFDQPELEELLRTNLKHYPRASLRGNVEVTDVAQDGADRVRVTYTDRVRRRRARVVEPTTCSAATEPTASSAPRSAPAWRTSGSSSAGSSSTSPPRPISTSGRASIRCATRTAPRTYMRIGETRYRWEFRLLDGETAADFATSMRSLRCIGPGSTGIR